jgi:carboxylesterase type B
VNCPLDENTIKCLREVDAVTLSKSSTKTGILWSLTADNYVVENQVGALQKGEFSKIPVFLNTDRDEGTFFALLLRANTKRKTDYLFDSLSPVFADRLDQLVNFYPRKTHQPHWQFGEAFGDFYFQCPTYFLARTLDKYQEVYVSRFNRIIETTNLLWIEQNLLGVVHASEVPHLWLYPILVLPSDKRQAERFHDTIMNFSKGNPPMNSTWPRYTGGKYRFDIANLKLESDYDRSEKCEFMIKAASDFYNEKSDLSLE